jgi:3-methyladenine DNA glycosylase AlkD
MNVSAEREYLLDRIRERADPEYKAGTSGVLRTQLKVHGVRVPHLREIARAWQQAHKKTASQDLLALVESLWDGDSQEERLLAVELLERYRRTVPDLTWNHFDRWRSKLDNWGLTDSLASRILAPWLIADPERRLDHLWALIADEDVWSRRLALVATVPINRGHTEFTIPDLTLQLVDQVAHERDPMITKAVSWALRELTKSHPDRVAAYLEDHREGLAAHVVREVEHKLRTGVRSGTSRRGIPAGAETHSVDEEA